MRSRHLFVPFLVLLALACPAIAATQRPSVRTFWVGGLIKTLTFRLPVPLDFALAHIRVRKVPGGVTGRLHRIRSRSSSTQAQEIWAGDQRVIEFTTNAPKHNQFQDRIQVDLVGKDGSTTSYIAGPLGK